MAKKRIRIRKVFTPNAYTLIVPYEFDTGDSGNLNFPIWISEEEILSALEILYSQMKNKPTPEETEQKKQRLTDKEID